MKVRVSLLIACLVVCKLVFAEKPSFAHFLHEYYGMSIESGESDIGRLGQFTAELKKLEGSQYTASSKLYDVSFKFEDEVLFRMKAEYVLGFDYRVYDFEIFDEYSYRKGL